VKIQFFEVFEITGAGGSLILIDSDSFPKYQNWQFSDIYHVN
jgi:hypothetical protein